MNYANLKNFFLLEIAKCAGIFIGNVLDLYINLENLKPIIGEDFQLAILSLPVHEDEMSLPFDLISLRKVL